MVHGVLDIFKFRIPADYDNGTGYACGLAALYQTQTGHAVHAHIGDYGFPDGAFMADRAQASSPAW